MLATSHTYGNIEKIQYWHHLAVTVFTNTHWADLQLLSNVIWVYDAQLQDAADAETPLLIWISHQAMNYMNFNTQKCFVQISYSQLGL